MKSSAPVPEKNDLLRAASEPEGKAKPVLQNKLQSLIDQSPRQQKGQALQRMADQFVQRQVHPAAPAQLMASADRDRVLEEVAAARYARMGSAIRRQAAKGMWKLNFNQWMENEYLRMQKIGAFDSTVVGADAIGQPVYETMYNSATEYLDDPAYTEEMFRGDLAAFNDYLDRSGRLKREADAEDVDVPQGTYFVSKAADLTAGISTSGLGPCVGVAVMAEGEDGKAYGMIHLQSSDDVATQLQAMIFDLLTAAGDDASIYAWLSGGAVMGVIDDTAEDLSGPTLFKQAEAFLMDHELVRSVDANMTEDNTGRNIRITRQGEDDGLFDVGYF